MVWKVIALLAMLAVLSAAAHAESESILSETNISQSALSAKTALLDAQQSIGDLSEAGLPTKRSDDLFQVALQVYSAALAIEAKGGTVDYSAVISQAQKIVALRNLAFETTDKLNALSASINRSKINVSEPLAIYNKALDDFNNERYENAQQNIDAGVSKLAELEAKSSQTAVLFEVSKSLGQRLLAAWKEVLIILAAVSIAIFLGYDRLSIHLTKSKISRLETEKHTIEDLIHKTQEAYFGKGTLSESVYHIKINKYGELIRDINRQLPLLRKEIETHSSNFTKKFVRKRK